MRFSLPVGLLFALALGACDDSVCTRNSDCKHGLVCGAELTCVLPPDLASTDGGSDGSTDGSQASDASGAEDDLASFDGSTLD